MRGTVGLGQIDVVLDAIGVLNEYAAGDLYVNIQNLCTITGYKGYDPEIGALNYNVLLRGVDDARYPSQRIYTFGLNFNF